MWNSAKRLPIYLNQIRLLTAIVYTVAHRRDLVLLSTKGDELLQGVSVAASPVIAMIGKPSVCPSVSHTLALCDHEIFTDG